MSNERQKIVNEIECGKIVDLFTGYGAIAIHLARKCGYIVAGDLNLEGLLLLKESINYNKLKGEIDVVNYDAKYLPFRDKTFDLGIADNPTIVSQFKEEICRVCKEAFFYILAHSTEEASNLIGLANWVKVNDYSKDLFIFKGESDVSNIATILLWSVLSFLTISLLMSFADLSELIITVASHM